MTRKILILGTLCLLLCISALPYLVGATKEDYQKNNGHSWEVYDPSYFLKYKTIHDIIDSADLQCSSKINSLTYYNYIANIIRKRFYHGFSYYSMSDNPFIFLSGKFIWSDLSAIVIPEDIMKHPMAACSQQAMVLMEIFRKKGINYRKVSFSHHYAVEGWIEGEWRYFDTDVEPQFHEKRESLDKLISENRFDSVYSAVFRMDDFRTATLHHTYGRVNESPAPRAELFHRTCFFLTSRYFLIGFSVLGLLFLMKPAVLRRMYLDYILRLSSKGS